MLREHINKLLLKATLFTPNVEAVQESDIEVRSLVCHDDSLMYLFAIKSFCLNLNYPIEVFVHDDGTLTKKDKEIFKKHIKNINIIESEKADKEIETFLKKRKLNNCLNFRKISSHSRKILDAVIMCKKERLILLDSDILFFAKPKEVKDWIEKKSNQMLYTQEPNFFTPTFNGRPMFENWQHFSQLLGLSCNKLKSFNSGFLCFPKKIVDFNLLEKIFGLMINADLDYRWLAEQTAFSLIACYNQSMPLPETYANRRWGKRGSYFPSVYRPVFRHHNGLRIKLHRGLTTKLDSKELSSDILKTFNLLRKK